MNGRERSTSSGSSEQRHFEKRGSQPSLQNRSRRPTGRLIPRVVDDSRADLARGVCPSDPGQRMESRTPARPTRLDADRNGGSSRSNDSSRNQLNVPISQTGKLPRMAGAGCGRKKSRKETVCDQFGGAESGAEFACVTCFAVDAGDPNSSRRRHSARDADRGAPRSQELA